MDNSAKISQIRTNYTLNTLDREQLAKHPMQQFEQWLNEAIEAKVAEPTAMHLATANKEGKPSGRIVLLKDTSQDGFTFYTNYQSRKGVEMAENPYGCLNFFWVELQRQVRIEGSIKKVSLEDSQSYFNSRPRGSQISALISPQSQVVKNRELLELKVRDAKKQYEGQDIPKPAHWGGYLLAPLYIEFWQGRASRLHDRLCYTLKNGEWTIERLAP